MLESEVKVCPHLVDSLLVSLLVQQLRALGLLQSVGVLLRLLQLDHPPPERLPSGNLGKQGLVLHEVCLDGLNLENYLTILKKTSSLWDR